MNFTDLSNLARKNSPTILTGLAVGGLVSTVILAVNATPKALSIIDTEVYSIYENRHAKDEDISFADFLGVSNEYDWADRKRIISPFETLRLTYKCYLPAVAVGGLTIMCIINANKVNLRRNAALASAYSLTDTLFKEYKDKVEETIGSNKARKINESIKQDHINEAHKRGTDVIITNNGELLCYDDMSGRLFTCDIEKIRRAEANLNRRLLSEMNMTLNEFYYEIGLPEIPLGENYGWNIDDGIIEISFSSHLTPENKPCLAIEYNVIAKGQYWG